MTLAGGRPAEVQQDYDVCCAHQHTCARMLTLVDSAALGYHADLTAVRRTLLLPLPLLPSLLPSLPLPPPPPLPPSLPPPPPPLPPPPPPPLLLPLAWLVPAQMYRYLRPRMLHANDIDELCEVRRALAVRKQRLSCPVSGMVFACQHSSYR
jgi:hypothetical protein